MKAREFYESAHEGDIFAKATQAEEHHNYAPLKRFVEQMNLSGKRCLEVGSGGGAFQDMVDDYTGIDLAESSGRHFHKQFSVASATHIPFADESFDGIWTINVLEHVPNPEKALSEIWRVLKPSGYLFLSPAWQCRVWHADGYPVRPYSDFDWRGKLIKASIPIRNSLIYRSLKLFPLRLWRLLSYILQPKPTQLWYGELEANFEIFWMPDSDAVNSIDPFEAYMWYISRGAIGINYQTLNQGFFVRNGPLILQKLP